MSDAIILGGEFVSEHYFGTDATRQSFRAKVLTRRKEWDEAKNNVEPSTRSRYTEERDSLGKTYAAIGEGDVDLPELYGRLRTILGFDGLGYDVEALETVLVVRGSGLTGAAPLVLIDAVGGLDLESLLDKDSPSLLREFPVDEKTVITSVARLLSHLFVADDGPRFALVFSGAVVLLAERERWAEGRYLAVDLQLVGERGDDRKGGEVDIALTCVSAESVAPDAEGNIWWTGVFEESVKHTVGVSQDLREGVRLSIEIIANDVVNRRRTQGLPALPQDQAQVLARQSLRFLYRILFLLYAEASPELGVLPVGEPAYERGYSLDRLRDLTLVELASPRSLNGTHLFDSLGVLFGLIDAGHDGGEANDEAGSLAEGLTFNALKADLFIEKATSLIDDVKLGNGELQRVLKHLLLSKKQANRDRGFISYAELGINQLGAVYEGLMSYTGFFAVTDLYEVAKNGDSSKGSWVVPHDRIDGISPDDFVRAIDENTGENKPVLHERGTFVFRLAGRERQQSASYYTPEVLTRFTVGQALAELLDQDGTTTTAREILDLTVCEPALGSGAFAIEAVQQLAEQYLTRRQKELDERIDPDAYAAELQRVKAYLALHQVYGVDLNATAVEFAEISLWLATMGEGLAAPWFGLHLKRGNSLIGARRSLVSSVQVKSAQWMAALPTDVRPGTDIASGSVHHFLLPSSGWGSSVAAKEAKALAPESLARLKEWQKSLKGKLTKQQTDRLQSLALRVERVWELAARRLVIAEQEIRRPIPIWGAADLPSGGAVTRDQIETSLADPRGAYQRLRRVMDAWCALWFWPLTDELVTVGGELIEPPTVEQWIDGCEMLLGKTVKIRPKNAGQAVIDAEDDWQSLGITEDTDLVYAGAVDPAKVVGIHPWLVVCERIAQRYGYFHWELDFAPVFAGGGGFDLQVGNPPWVRPRSDVEALLAEADPWWQLKSKSNAQQDAEHRAKALLVPGTQELLLDGTVEIAAIAAFVGSAAHYPHLVGLQPDLYRCFMELTWRNSKSSGLVGLIHLESHFTDEKAGNLRGETYQRLRRHWQFINELLLFEIEDHKRYGIHVYGSVREPNFRQAASIYHPMTVERSLEHDGSGVEPGIKDADGRWDVRPHSSRIVHVNPDTLASWHAVLETDDIPVSQTRMVYAVNKSTVDVLEKLATAPRIGSLGLQFSRGWDETIDRRKGHFDAEWGVPESWDQVILQGPHLHVATPFYKVPNPTMLHNQDWTPTDFEALAPDAIPATAYKPRGEPAKYDASYTHWRTAEGSRAARDFYRVAWRNMAANTGERTLIAAIVPPGSAHVHTVYDYGAPDLSGTDLVRVAASLGSIISDFGVRTAPKSSISWDTASRLPLPTCLTAEIVLRTLRLNCVTSAYAELWAECFDDSFADDEWAGGVARLNRPKLAAVLPTWTVETPLRIAADRRQALIEIDALLAVAIGLTASELCTIYRTQFPVMYGYDRGLGSNPLYYDTLGRLVPTAVLAAWRKVGGDHRRLEPEDLAATSPTDGRTIEFVPPFSTLDRDRDLREAYGVFADRVLNRRANSA